jgi:hypothetical protein
MQGSWSQIDLCRGYVYLVFPKNKLKEHKAELHAEMIDLINRQFVTTCH